MYRGSGSYSAYSEAKDFSVALFMEDPARVARYRSRRYYNVSVDNGASFGRTWTAWTIKDVLGMVVHTYPVGTPSGSIRLRFYSNTYGVLVDKTIPYSTTIGFSITDLPAEFLAHASDNDNFQINVYNYTGVQIYINYITVAPLMFINSLSGLKSVNCGESLGNDEYFPEFGVSHMYGSFEFQDRQRALLGVLTSPTSYGLDANLARYHLRCEAYVGTQLAGVLLVDEFQFAEDNRRVSATLKSALFDLDSIPGLGPRLANMATKKLLSTALAEYFAYTKTEYPDTLAQYDFGNVSSCYTAQYYYIKGPLAVTSGTTVLGFLEKVAQAMGCVIGIRHVLTTTMQYEFTVYGRTSVGTAYEQAMGWVAYQYGYLKPYDIIGELEYTPIKKNYMDKITYSKYEVGVSENAQEVTIDYELVNLEGYEDAGDDKTAFKTYWKGKSSSSGWPENNALETSFGMRIPRPRDVTYDSTLGKYVANYTELERSEARALTRGFLWRFKFATSFRNCKFSTTTIGSVVSTMETKAAYGAGNYDSSYMVVARDTAYASYGAREFKYYDWNGNGQTVKVTLCAMSKIFWANKIFDYMPSLYTLHLKIPAGYYLVDGQSYTITQYFSYWFSPVYGFNPWTRKEDWEYEDRSFTNLPEEGAYAYDRNWNVQPWNPEWDRISDYFTLKLSANQFTAYKMGHAGGVYKKDIDATFNTYNYGDPYTIPGTLTKMVGTNNDIDGGYGAPVTCFNLDDPTYDQSNGHSGENTIWPAYDPSGIEDNKHWFHTGFDGDTTAKGDATYTKVAQTNVSASTIFGHTNQQDEHGNVFVEWPLPSSTTLRSAIINGQDNFLDGPQKKNSEWIGTEDGNPGANMAVRANGYCTFWSVGGFSSIQGRTEMVYSASSPTTEFTWRNPRPSYGFCVKAVRYGVSGRFLEIRQGETYTVQYNKQNQYNYDLATNELMSDLLTLLRSGAYVNAVEWLVSDLATKYAQGKTVYWVKAKLRGLYQASTSSAAPFVRHYYLNDLIYQVYAKRNGQDVNMLKTSSASVQAVEYVMDNGECYVNLRLLDS